MHNLRALDANIEAFPGELTPTLEVGFCLRVEQMFQRQESQVKRLGTIGPAVA